MKEILQVSLPLVGCVALFIVIMWVVPPTCKREDTASAVTPVPATNDHIIPDYIKSVHQQEAACDELAATADRLESTAQECMKTLRQCTDMLKSNYLIPKRTTEKEK